MVKARSVVLAATAIALAISGYFWLRLGAERKLAGGGQSVVDSLLQTRESLDPVHPSGPNLRPLGADNRQLSTPPAIDRNAEVPAVTQLTANGAQLTSPEFARQLIARNYPDLRADLGFSTEDVETLAALIASGTYPEESERALGAYKYQQWMEYRRAKDAKLNVDALQKRLSGTPLNEYQINALTLVLQDEQRRRDEQAPRQAPVASDTRSKLDNEIREARLEIAKRSSIADQARLFLGEQQIAALQDDSYAKFYSDLLASLEAKRAALDEVGR